VDGFQFDMGSDLSPDHVEIAQAETTQIEPFDAMAAIVALCLHH
jgi:pullulanase/glycogen debranching enzyme